MLPVSEVNINLSARQSLALDALEDDHTSEVLYGGGAGGGKSYLGCIWHVAMRLKYPMSRGLIGRAELVTLKKSTMNTLWRVCTEMGLKAGIDYVFNAQDNVIKWNNGSQTLFIPLAWKPSDPDYTTLGGLELTDAFIDEANEVPERAVAIVMSRIRWMIADYNLHAKVLLTCNPGYHWIRDKYIKDRAGNPIVLKPYQTFIQALVTDNPDRRFVENYQRNLEKMNDYDRSRLLHGDWDAVELTGGEFYKGFEGSRIIKPIGYDEGLPLHLSFDFNVKPYITCTIWQISRTQGAGYVANQIDEACLESPKNSTHALCRELLERYRGHYSGVYVYGDPSGRHEDTRSEVGFNDYKIIGKELARWHPQFRVDSKAPAVAMRGRWVSSLLRGEDEGLSIAIAPECIRTIEDYLKVKESADGGKDKKRVTDPLTRVSYEPYGHTSDANDYFLCAAFAEKFDLYARGGKIERPVMRRLRENRLGRW